MHQYRVAVLRGGPSEEYEVSLRTGESVLGALDRNRYHPLDVVITKAGEWLLNGRVKVPHELLGTVDGVFIALHGAYGEDGTIQRILERHGVPYTGSRSFPSAIALNKVMTKDRLSREGVRMARHMPVSASANANIEGLTHSIGELFGPKYILKPVNGGSSIGTIIVENQHALFSALTHMLSRYEQVLVEEYIEGREATCGVINNFRGQPLYALPVVEIVPPTDASFFNYDVKYNGKTEEICPGRFSSAEKNEVEAIAKLAHQTLELSQYSRSDFIIAQDGIYFLETNTLPGLTSESLFPKALSAVGCTYNQFIEHVMTDMLENHRR